MLVPLEIDNSMGALAGHDDWSYTDLRDYRHGMSTAMNQDKCDDCFQKRCDGFVPQGELDIHKQPRSSGA